MTTEQLVIVDPADAELVRRLASENGVEASELEVQGFEPITTVTFVLIGALAAVAAVSHLLEVHKGGQLIDLRPDAPKPVSRTKDVVYGLVVVISEEGKVTVEVKEPKEMFSAVIEALQAIALGIGKASIDAIAAAAKDQFGDKVDVEVEKAPPAQ